MNKLTLTVNHTCKTAGEELQTAFPLLRGRVHATNIVDMEQPARHCNNERCPRNVHVVYTFRKCMGRLLCG